MHIKQERRCVACRKPKIQTDLLRISKIDNYFQLDVNNKLGGRGAYVCKNNECINITIKKHLLNKSFRMNVPNEIYDKLAEYDNLNCLN